MIYVGKKIIVVDFSVRDSKTYSFFINDELCEIRLERKDMKMLYHFEINKEADTPRNKARKKTEKKYFRQSLIFMGTILAAIIMLSIFFSNTLKPQKAMVELLEHPSKTVGQIKIDSTKKPPLLTYFFIAQNKSFTEQSNHFEQAKSLQFNLLPLESGDEFVVEYAQSNPSVNKIRFEQPTEKQIATYATRAFQQHLKLNPNLEAKKEACKFDIAYKMKGLPALADFYFQNTSSLDNSKHNKKSYLRLVRSLPFTKEVDKNCW